MSRNRIIRLLIALVVTAFVALLLKRESPFGWLFNIALNGFLIGVIGLALSFGVYLFTRKSPIFKAIAGIVTLFGVSMLLFQGIWNLCVGS